MATLDMEAGDVLEVLANHCDYQYIAELFNEYKDLDATSEETRARIGLSILVALNDYADKYCVITEQQLADARECDKSHARRDRLSEVA